MARMRIFLVLVLAITAGGGLAFGTYNYMQKLPARTVTIPTRPVVVAATDLDVGTELGAGEPSDDRVARQRRAGQRDRQSRRMWSAAG